MCGKSPREGWLHLAAGRRVSAGTVQLIALLSFHLCMCHSLLNSTPGGPCRSQMPQPLELPTWCPHLRELTCSAGVPCLRGSVAGSESSSLTWSSPVGQQVQARFLGDGHKRKSGLPLTAEPVSLHEAANLRGASGAETRDRAGEGRGDRATLLLTLM